MSAATSGFRRQPALVGGCHPAIARRVARPLRIPPRHSLTLEDALIDLTNRGEIVLDPFLGSGSTLMAAENTGRVCCGVELDPLYVDVIIRRYETATGTTAILADWRALRNGCGPQA
ncbi:DNA methyltransferase [Bradyrhizobium sp. AZCC 2289]|uniref:DNA methyltransferase n=1 Tax=Bradyrhizobium sp. AZCC 2289 TaxID=3117026 RepID=UPI002FF0CC7C